MIVILLGPPGSGKSTQAKLLSEKLHVPAISMGQILRDAKKARTVLGGEAARYVEDGRLVPSRMIEALTKFRLEEKDCQGGFILDGAPRKVEEAIALDSYLRQKGQKVTHVILIDISDEVAIKRLLSRYQLPSDQGGKRLDDNIEDVRVRLVEFHDSIDPVKVYYTQQDLFHIIDGMPSEQEVHEQLCALLQL